MKIIGISESKGAYEGFKYHNYIFYCENSGMPAVSGVVVERFKIKSDVISNFYERFGNGEKLNDFFNYLIGKKIRIFYNRYGQPNEIDLIEK